MEFAEILKQIIALLQRQGRVSYGALKRQFTLDDDYLDDLKVEIIEAQRLAVDENGRILVWVGEPGAAPLSVAPPVTDTARRQPPTPRCIWRRKFLPPAPPSQANASRSPSCSLTSKTRPS